MESPPVRPVVDVINESVDHEEMYRIIAFDPVNEFIAELNDDAKGKIFRTINLLETHGYLLGMPHSRHIVGKIHELRMRGVMEIRIFYAYHQQIFYLLHGFIKKTQKTPEKELEIAERRFLSLTNK